MGTPKAAVPSLERLYREGHQIIGIYTQPDRPSGRGHKITLSPVKEFALSHGLPVYQPQKVKTPEALELFLSHAADLAVVVAYGRILPGTFLNAFPKGALNVHFSLLPKYRGAAPVNWAIASGEIETGVTTMQMDDGLDTGGILLQQKTDIGSDEDSIHLMDRLSVIGAQLLSDTLDRLDDLEPRKQDDSKASLAPILTKEDGLIEWTMSATSVVARIRGFQPFPTAYTYYNGRKLTLWSAEAVEYAQERFVPGQIASARGDDLYVSTGQGAIKVRELQIEGKKRLPVRDFLNGIKIHTGDILGKL